MVFPKIHRLTWSLKLCEWKESLMETSLLYPHTALSQAHSFNQVNMAIAAHLLPPVWVSPDPSVGVSRTRHFGLGVLDSLSGGSGSTVQPFQQFHWAHQEVFPFTRAQMSSLEKCLVLSYNSPHPGPYPQVDNTTSILGVLGLGVILFDSSKVISEKHLKLDLEVLVSPIFSTTFLLQFMVMMMINFKHNQLLI